MSKYYTKRVLENGLTIYLFNDNKKNRTVGTIFTFAGGNDSHFIYDGKEYNQVNGVAHLLEHYLLEKSIYGNIMNYFDDEYIGSNGSTSNVKTEFYISTVHDFEDNFIKLLNIVNNPKFDEEAIQDIKNPIVREIKRAKDNPTLEYDNYVNDTIFHSIKSNITLGNEEDIMNMSIDDIKIFHEAFYQPSNQMIVISGRFDEERIIKIIEDEYEKFKRDYKETIKDVIKEDVSLPSKEGLFVDKNKDEDFQIIYKMNVSNLSKKERILLRYFVRYVLDNNFSVRVGFYDLLKSKKISMYSAQYGSYYEEDKDIYIIYLDLTTSKMDEAKELLLNTMSNLKYDRESFKKDTNYELIECINAMESIHSIANHFVNNLINYDYEYIEDVEEIKAIDYDQCLELFNKLDFTNYCIIKRIKGE